MLTLPELRALQARLAIVACPACGYAAEINPHFIKGPEALVRCAKCDDWHPMGEGVVVADDSLYREYERLTEECLKLGNWLTGRQGMALPGDEWERHFRSYEGRLRALRAAGERLRAAGRDDGAGEGR